MYLGGWFVGWFGGLFWLVYALVLRVFVASLAVDLASLCWSPRTPQFLGRRFWTRGQ